MSEKYLSDAYNTRDEAAVAGFLKVGMQGQQVVDSKEFGFWVIQKPDRTGVINTTIQPQKKVQGMA
jgi:hypothetical protein